MSEEDLISSIDESNADDLSRVPVLPLRDVVVYPHMVIPLFVGRERSIVALNKASRRSNQARAIRYVAGIVKVPQTAAAKRSAPGVRPSKFTVAAMR